MDSHEFSNHEYKHHFIKSSNHIYQLYPQPCTHSCIHAHYKNWAHRNIWTKTKLTNRSHKQFTQNWHETMQKMGCNCIMLSLIKKSKLIQSGWFLQCNTLVLITRQFEYMRGNSNWLTHTNWMDNMMCLSHYQSLTS